KQVQRPRALPNLLSLYRHIVLNTAGTDRQVLWSNWKARVSDCAGLPQLEAQDWSLLGACLPLGPEAGHMEVQIRQLSHVLGGSRALVHLLHGWLAQRFAEAMDPTRETLARATEHQQFQAVWQHTKTFIARLSPEERKALGIEVKPALKSMVRQYEGLLI